MTSLKTHVLHTFLVFVASIFLPLNLASAATFETQVNSSTDDAEEYSNGTVKHTSSDLELADSDESNDQTIGIRFNNIDLPAGAIISAAYLQFQVDETSSGASALTITGEANDNPATYSSATNNITNRPQTTASANWNPADWTTVGSNGIEQQTSDLSGIIQELVNRSGWNSGQSMAFMITGTGTRTAESFNGSPAGAPILHIEYSTDGNPAPVASFTATPTSGNAPLNVSFDGTASTDDSAIASYDWAFGDGTSATGVTASHSYTPGSYTATLTITDDAGKTNSSSQTITVIDPNSPTALDIQVSNSSDDAEEYANGTVNTDSSDLELTQDSSSQTIGMRFNHIALPTDAVISKAYLQFQVDEATITTTQLTIYGEANANPAGFNTTANNITRRPLTNASSTWTPSPWSNVKEQGAAQRSTNISAIVQELVGQSGWNSGQSMVFIINGTGERTAESFDGSPAGAPILHIEYSTDGNPAPVASFTATPTTGNAPLDVSFDGTASSDDNAIASYDWAFGDGTSATGATANHTYTPGTYTATLTVTDDAGKTNSSSQTITVIDPNAPTALDIQVSSSTDDAEEYANGTVNTDSSDLELTQDSSSQTIGMRFNGIALPTDAVISSAYLQFQVDEATTAATQLTVYGEANANPAGFNTTANNITRRPLTNASSTWTPSPWSNVKEQGAAQRSTNISAIVQELVGQSGWNSGQSMVFIINGTGERTAESFDGSPAGAPILHIKYSTDGNPAPVASFTATPTTGNAPLDVSFDGAASSDDSAIASYDWNFGDGTSATGTTASHTYTPGSYTATLTVTDDAGKTNSSSQTITVIDPSAPLSLAISISSSSDDAEEAQNGSVNLTSSDLELTTESSIQTVGVRFNGIDLPANAVITNAYIQFQVDETTSETTQLTIYGQATDNPGTFASTLNNIFNRPLTVASSSWSPTPWTTVGERDVVQRTTNINSIIQELIGSEGWNSGQSIVFIIKGAGKRVAESFDGAGASASTLHVDYFLDNNPAPIASFTANPNNGEAPLDVQFDATSSTDDSSIARYDWDFGDGTTANNESSQINHTYQTPGTYTATLTVTDNEGKTNSISETITVNFPPLTRTVIINEIMAINKGGLADGEGDTPDWIELYNTSATAVDISGWCISDVEAEPTQWCFPTATSLGANEYLLVFASKKQPSLALEGEFHAQLKLDGDGEYLALFTADGRVADSFIPSFPKQIKNVSYGRVNDESLRYFPTPTPGSVNGVGVADVLEFTPNTLDLSGADGLVTAQVSLGTLNNGTVPYILNSDVSWLNAATSNGQDGNTIDLIEITANLATLEDGIYNGIITASSNDHHAATLGVTLSVSQQADIEVVINEILAGNTGGLADGEGDFPDWIELHNERSQAADISNWCLSDDDTNPTLWCLPTGTQIAANDYLIVFASGKSPSEALSGEHHASFKLSKKGEYLALYRNDGSIADSFSPKFPPQQDDISYGNDLSGAHVFFDTPTPNASNGTGFVSALEFDKEEITLLGVSGNLSSKTTLSVINGDNINYTLNVDNQGAGWLSASTASGEDGQTSDLISITANAGGLDAGVYFGTVTASANSYSSTTIAVKLVVTLSANEWLERDIKFENKAVAIDETSSRIFYPLDPNGFEQPTSFAPKLTYNETGGYKIGINQNQPLDTGTVANFGNVSYGAGNTIELYKNGTKIDEYSVVFSSLSIINMQAESIVREPRKAGVFRVISTLFDQDTGFMNMGIETRGRSAGRYPKLPYAIELSEGVFPSVEKKIKLLELIKNDDWILDAQYRDTTFSRNLVSNDLARAIQPYAFIDESGQERGQSALKGHFTEVVLNNEYWGIYILHEKVDRKSLDLTKVTVPEDAEGNNQWDQVDFSDPKNGSVLYKAQLNATLDSSDSNEFEQKYPKVTDIDRPEPLNQLIDFVTNSNDDEFIANVAQKVDLDSVLNFWLVSNISNNKDTYEYNYFLARSESGKFFFVLWDVDASYGLRVSGAPRVGGIGGSWRPDANLLISRLLALPETGFEAMMKTKWNELRTTILSEEAIIQRFQEYKSQMEKGSSTSSAKQRNLTRWPNSGGDGAGDPNVGTLGFIQEALQAQIVFLDGKIGLFE